MLGIGLFAHVLVCLFWVTCILAGNKKREQYMKLGSRDVETLSSTSFTLRFSKSSNQRRAGQEGGRVSLLTDPSDGRTGGKRHEPTCGQSNGRAVGW